MDRFSLDFKKQLGDSMGISEDDPARALVQPGEEYESLDAMVPKEESMASEQEPAFFNPKEQPQVQAVSRFPALADNAASPDRTALFEKAQQDAVQQLKENAQSKGMLGLLSGVAAMKGGKPDFSLQTQGMTDREEAAKLAAQNIPSQRKFELENQNTDPNSQTSKTFRKAIEQVAPWLSSKYGADWNKVSAADKDHIWDMVKVKEQIDARKELAKERTAGANKESLLEKKEQLKEDAQVKKENRKTRAEINKSQQSAEGILRDLEDAKTKFDAYSKSNITGTGPLATLGGLTKYVSADTEKLNAAFKKLSMDQMVKQFAGMSKAIDSDAERRAFESTQPSVANDDPTNKQILEDRIRDIKNLIAKHKAAKSQFDVQGNRVAPEPEAEDLQSNLQSGQEIIEKDGKKYLVDHNTQQVLKEIK